MVAKKKTYKIELFPLLRNISTKNVGYYDSLTEENLKEFTPFVIMRWLTGGNDGRNLSARQIYFLNELVNPYAFEFTRRDSMHKKLLYNLMTISTTGKDYRYTFNKVKRGNNTMPRTIEIIQEVFGYNCREAKDAVVLLTDEAIVSMAEQLGKQDGEIKELKKELKTKRPR